MPKKQKRKNEMTPRQMAFCECYERNAGDLRRVCQSLDITSARAAALMEVPAVKERLARSVDIARQRLEATAPHLVSLALELVNDDNVSVKVRASLLDSLLDRAGVCAPKTPAVSVTINTQIQDRAREILAEREKQRLAPAIEVQVEK